MQIQIHVGHPTTRAFLRERVLELIATHLMMAQARLPATPMNMPSYFAPTMGNFFILAITKANRSTKF